MKYVRAYLVLALVAGLVVSLDQWTKALVRDSLSLGQSWMPLDWLAPYARIVHWYNTGVAFGMFQGQNLIFSILAILVSLAIIYYYPHIPENECLLRLALGLQLSGALGNLVDRITIGHVTDFISLGNFPVFNVADSSISVGVVLLLLSVYLQERKLKKTQTAEQDQPGETKPVSNENEKLLS